MSIAIRRPILFVAVAGAVLLGLSLSPQPSGPGGTASGIALVGSEATAAPPRAHARRAARRTARRVTRRTIRRRTYIRALPRGCRWRAPSHYCGGIDYQ
ncbi:MAG: hypothetical protein AAF899_16820, partial [Pseudomonadota bacterium]